MDYEIIAFTSQAKFRQWLATHGATTQGIWLRIYKKATKIDTVTYAQALDVALCYGWIDGQKKSYDEQSFLQKFTPRRPRSMWSKRNIEHIERLTAAGLMTAAGDAEVEKAKADGRWAAAYDAPSTMQAPDYFLQELKKHPKAKAQFEQLNKTNTYAIAWHLQTAKTNPTRQRRMDKIIAMLNDGQKMY